MQMKGKHLSKQEIDPLYSLAMAPEANRQHLDESGYLLKTVSRVRRTSTNNDYLDERSQSTPQVRNRIKGLKPQNAIILAAGFGMRMVPINMKTPKALLEVNGERLIERLITQLHEVGTTDISVVAGFMKESFEYLIDKYGVDLVVNEEYAVKNNISSLALVLDRLQNAYIVPCDIWCDHNPFRSNEPNSWYMVSDLVDDTSDVRINRKMELIRISHKNGGNAMIGICYLTGDICEIVKDRIIAFAADPDYDDRFWEEALYEEDRMIVPARVVHASDVVEINTYEQLRDLDAASNHLQSDALDVISEVFQITSNGIVDIEVLKKGMTNRSFLFSVYGKKYIMRIPGEGTDQLINRAEEAEVFRTISGLGLCDDPVYINSENGYKITKFLDGIRGCDPYSSSDLRRCMGKLREFHGMKLSVPHSFDLFGQIEFYESLWEGLPSQYGDYEQTKTRVLSLKPFIDALEKDWCLTHIDAVPDNFLFYQAEGEKEERLQLTDWEYAGMQDPHVDIAMFCIYSLYDKKHVDRLIDIYFENKCDKTTRTKIYAYISICGLLWSNWCEYKRNLGVIFGEYSLRQYRYAKNYYRYATKMINELSAGEE